MNLYCAEFRLHFAEAQTLACFLGHCIQRTATNCKIPPCTATDSSTTATSAAVGPLPSLTRRVSSTAPRDDIPLTSSHRPSSCHFVQSRHEFSPNAILKKKKGSRQSGQAWSKLSTEQRTFTRTRLDIPIRSRGAIVHRSSAVACPPHHHPPGQDPYQVFFLMSTQKNKTKPSAT